MAILPLRVAQFGQSCISLVSRSIPFPALPLAIGAIALTAKAYQMIQRYRYSLDYDSFAQRTTLKANLSEDDLRILDTAMRKLFPENMPLASRAETRLSLAMSQAIRKGTVDDVKALLPLYSKTYDLYVGNEVDDTPARLALEHGRWDMAKEILRSRGCFRVIQDDTAFEALEQKEGLEILVKEAAVGTYVGEIEKLIRTGIIPPNVKIDGQPALEYLFSTSDLTRESRLVCALMKRDVDFDIKVGDVSLFEVGVENADKTSAFVALLEELWVKKTNGELSSEEEHRLKRVLSRNLSSKSSLMVRMLTRIKELEDEPLQMTATIRNLKKALNLVVLLSSEKALNTKDGNGVSVIDLTKTDSKIASMVIRFRCSYVSNELEWQASPKAEKWTSTYFALKPIYTSELAGIHNESGNDCFFDSCLQVLDQDFFDFFDPAKNKVVSQRDLRALLPDGDTYRQKLKQLGKKNIKQVQAHLKEVQSKVFQFLTKMRKNRDGAAVSGVHELRTYLHNCGFIEAVPGSQEDISLVLNNFIHMLFIFTAKKDKLELSNRKNAVIPREMLPEDRDSWEKITDQRVIDGFSGPYGDTLYKEDPDGNFTFSVEDRQYAYKMMVDRKDLDYVVKSMFTDESQENYPENKPPVYRYIQEAESGDIYRVPIKAQVMRDQLSVQGDYAVCHVKRVPIADRKALSWGSATPKVKFPVMTKNTRGEDMVLSSFSFHIGSSASGGHYVSGRLIHSEERNKWEWHIFNDATTERMIQGAAEKLEDVTLPYGDSTGYNIGQLLEEKSTCVVYKKRELLEA